MIVIAIAVVSDGVLRKGSLSSGRRSKLRTMSSCMAKLVTMSTGPFDSVCQGGFDFLCLAKWDLLSVSLGDSVNDILNVCIQIHAHELWYGVQQEFELASLGAFDVLMRFPEVRVEAKRLAGMIIIACSNLGISPFDTVVCSYSKRAVRARTTAGADSMAVAVKDMWGPIALNGPVAKCIFKVQQGWENLTLNDWRHGVFFFPPNAKRQP